MIEVESKRDPFADLGPQLVADPFTEQEVFVHVLIKLKQGKACGSTIRIVQDTLTGNARDRNE